MKISVRCGKNEISRADGDASCFGEKFKIIASIISEGSLLRRRGDFLLLRIVAVGSDIADVSADIIVDGHTVCHIGIYLKCGIHRTVPVFRGQDTDGTGPVCGSPGRGDFHRVFIVV